VVDLKRPRTRGRASVIAPEGNPLGLICKSQLAPDALRASGHWATESLADPRDGLRGRRDDERSVAVDRDQLQRFQPDRERALADKVGELCPDPLPLRAVLGGWQAEASADLGEVDPDGAPPLATAIGDVGLLDDDRVRTAPPFRGAGGVFWGSGVLGFLPLARVGCRGFCRGFCRPFCRGFRRRELDKRPILTALYDRDPGTNRTLLDGNCPVWPPFTAETSVRTGQFSAGTVRSWPPFASEELLVPARSSAATPARVAATSGLAPAGGGTLRATNRGATPLGRRGSGTVQTLVFPRPPAPLRSTSSPDASSTCRARLTSCP